MSFRNFLAIALVCVASPLSAQQTAQTPLLAPSRGQIPNDTGSDGLTKMSIEKSPEIGGDALKVVFAPGDSFGVRSSSVKNWKPFRELKFTVFNPGKEPAKLELNILHKRTSNYQTRVVLPFTVVAGKVNHLDVPLDGLTNVNGSAADLSNIVKWFISSVPGQSPTLYFGDFILDGAEPAPAAPGVLLPQGGFRVQGTIGDKKVDLTITPLGSSPLEKTAAQKTEVKGDPARLERIRAAKMPAVEKVVAFDTPEADAILSALEVFPPNNPWNLVVSDWPLHPKSKEMIANVGADNPFRMNMDMGFSIVPPKQPRVNLKVVDYPGESDKGPFPIPDSVPIEGWPVGYKGVSLDAVQRNVKKEQGDRHAIVLDPTNRMLYEFFVMRKTDAGWEAAQASVFDLKSNKLRPDGWTSADAAGLPIFPAVVRYDEIKRGIVEHPMRVTIRKSRKDYVYPATHHAGHTTDETVMRMGERLRLKKDFDISGFSPEAQAILKGLQKYGMFVADNGIEWAISVAPDPRIPNMSAELRKVKGSDFEVVEPPAGYQPAAD